MGEKKKEEKLIKPPFIFLLVIQIELSRVKEEAVRSKSVHIIPRANLVQIIWKIRKPLPVVTHISNKELNRLKVWKGILVAQHY